MLLGEIVAPVRLSEGRMDAHNAPRVNREAKRPMKTPREIRGPLGRRRHGAFSARRDRAEAVRNDEHGANAALRQAVLQSMASESQRTTSCRREAPLAADCPWRRSVASPLAVASDSCGAV